MKRFSYLLITASLALTSCAHHASKKCADKCDTKAKQCKTKKCEIKKQESDCCK